MPVKPDLSPATGSLLEYLQDLGFEDLYLQSESSGEGIGVTDSSAALEALELEASTCERCGLSQGRQSVVFGSGSPRADLMFIGEGPGAEEDRRGLPFVGRAGELLTKIIAAIVRGSSNTISSSSCSKHCFP